VVFDVHLVDGTYELFRYHYAPNNRDATLGATRGVVGSCLQLLEGGASHVGVAIMSRCVGSHARVLIVRRRCRRFEGPPMATVSRTLAGLPPWPPLGAGLEE